MKKIIAVAAMFALLSSATASEVKLAWDASATAGVTNHIVYAFTNATLSTAPIVKQSVGTNLTATILTPPVSSRWWFIVTAVKDGVESLPSNVVSVEFPAAPTNIRVVSTQP